MRTKIHQLSFRDDEAARASRSPLSPSSPDASSIHSGLVLTPRLREVFLISLFRTQSMSNFLIRLETDGDAPALSPLSADAFGPGRFARSAYRVREGIPPFKALSLVGWREQRLVGGHSLHRHQHR